MLRRLRCGSPQIVCKKSFVINLKPILSQFAPAIFVLLWSTGFIGAKWGLPHASPLSFLSVRYALVILFMVIIARYFRASYPRDPRQWLHLGIAGLLLHGVYLAGVFSAIHRGLPAGITAIIVGLQPIFTAIGAGILFHEKIVVKQWWGLALGLLGVALVVSGKWGHGFTLATGLFAVAALIGITVGTLYQKTFCAHFDWRSGAVLQFLPSALITPIFAWWLEGFAIEWSGEFVFALMWLVIVLSLGAIGLLNYLIRQGSAINVARLFYLTPGCTALIAWMVFGESLTWLMFIGMTITMVGVILSRADH